MKRNKILRDTVFLTAVEFLMEGLSLLVNIFITRHSGTEIIGKLSLIGSFFAFVTIISSGNVYLSTSRFISEEIGKKCGDPDKVLRYGMRTSMVMSIITGTAIFLSAKVVSVKFLDTPDLVISIRILAAILPVCSLSACFKGYFTALRKVFLPSVCGVLEFLVRSLLLCILVKYNIFDIFTAFALSIAAGQLTGLIFLSIFYFKTRKASYNSCTISFKRFIMLSIPIFLNSLVTSVLSSANDALVPMTLKQYGNSTSEAFSQFGIFEAIVIPALFFPSSILCSLSSILVPELARERGAENTSRNNSLIKKTLNRAFSFSFFAAVFFFCFGDEIGYLMSGDIFAGKIIAILAPAVPFIYLEIILEGILKGMGRHTFSSVNYLAEYIIRITVLLICVPLFGFYGIVASYLASNITCNISRLIMIMKITDIPFDISDNIIIPLVSGGTALLAVSITETLFHAENMDILPKTIIFAVFMGSIYLLLIKAIRFIVIKDCKDKVKV